MNRRRFVQSSLAAAVAASLPVNNGLAALLGPAATVAAGPSNARAVIANYESNT